MTTNTALLLYITSLLSNVYALTIESGYYFIINEVSGKSLNCGATPIQQTSLIQSPSQIFKIITTSSWSGGHMHYQVRCMESPYYCWDYQGSDGKIGQSTCSETNADQWHKFYPMSTGDYTFKITGAYGKYLYMTSTSDSGQLKTTYSSSSGQSFTVLPADYDRLHLSDVPPTPQDYNTDKYYGIFAFFSSVSNVMILLMLISNIALVWLHCAQCSKTRAQNRYLPVKSIDTDSEVEALNA